MNVAVMLLQGAIVVPFAFVLIIFFIIAGLVLARVFGEAVRRNPNANEGEEKSEEGEDSGDEDGHGG
jgi:Na+-transporting methylmalonyl-CoA/oxaloacetate decarboxylase gamma subunit